MRRPDALAKWIDNWRELNFYARFEQVVALLLSLLVSVVVVLATIRLFLNIADSVMLFPDIDSYEIFRTIFGMIMVVLISLEFNHTIVQVFERKESIVQARVVVIIAILAVVRKLIVMDIDETANATLLALAAIVIALGATYWLMHDADKRCSRVERNETEV